MPLRDTATQPFHDLLSAFALLSRLPVPATERHRPQAAWAWPLVGVAIGALATISAFVAMKIGLTGGISAAIFIVVSVLATGALHEDGMADTVDGLFGGWTTERRLEIMKDSHIGSYGTLALIFAILIRWQAVEQVLNAGRFELLIAIAALSRAPMAVLMTALPNARKSGLSQHVGQPGWAAASMAALIALVIATTLAGRMVVALAAVVILMAGGMAALAKRRIGGQTGDILGATQQICDLGALCAATAVLYTA